MHADALEQAEELRKAIQEVIPEMIFLLMSLLRSWVRMLGLGCLDGYLYDERKKIKPTMMLK